MEMRQHLVLLLLVSCTLLASTSDIEMNTQAERASRRILEWREMHRSEREQTCRSSDQNELETSREWQANGTLALADMLAHYHEAVINVRRFSRYRWNAWAYDDKPAALGIKAYALCHVRQRCASAERMVRAVGFDVEIVKSHSYDAAQLDKLRAEGKVSHLMLKDATTEQSLRYIAAALDHRRLVEMAVNANHSWVAIFEDDVILTSSPSLAASRIKGAMAVLPADADSLYMEYCYEHCPKALYNNNPWISKAHEPYCSAAIIYSAQGLWKLLASLSTISTVHDGHLAKRCRHGHLNCYKLRHPIYAQDAYWGSAVSSHRPQLHVFSHNKHQNAYAAEHHDLHWDVPLCRESEVRFIRDEPANALARSATHDIMSYEDNSSAVRELTRKQAPQPHNLLASLTIQMHHFPPTLAVKVGHLAESTVADFLLTVVRDGAEVLRQTRVLVVEEGERGMAFEASVPGAHRRTGGTAVDVSPGGEAHGSGMRKCSHRYEVEAVVIDSFPNLTADERLLAVYRDVHVVGACL